MAIPDYQTMMLPLLQLAGDGKEHRFRDAVEQLALQFRLTDAERNERVPSGNSPLFNDRVAWARTYMKQAGLLSSENRGYFRITNAGAELVAQKPEKINCALLKKYETFRAFQSRRRDQSNAQQTIGSLKPSSDQTPEDTLAFAYQELRKTLENELLEQIKACSSAFFERLVIDLLVAMGYGGSRQDAGRALGRSGDGGIDGLIKEDKLGLDVIYLQAKRWEGTVGRPEIQKFSGALQGKHAHKGVFITTSNFSREAEEFTAVINTKIILIDGAYLVRLMVDHDVGVVRTGGYELKKIDMDYFEG